MRVLIDTNLILDYMLDRDGHFDDALNLLITVVNEEIEGYITANTITDLFYIINKTFHNKRKSRAAMDKILRLVKIIDCTGTDCVLALVNPIKDFEDAVLVECGLRTGMDYLVTNNIKDFKGSRLPVMRPGEFLTRFDTGSL